VHGHGILLEIRRLLIERIPELAIRLKAAIENGTVVPGVQDRAFLIAAPRHVDVEAFLDLGVEVLRRRGLLQHVEERLHAAHCPFMRDIQVGEELLA